MQNYGLRRIALSTQHSAGDFETGEVESEVAIRELGKRRIEAMEHTSSTRGWLRVYETYG
jgi:hypothetical protein